MAHQVVALTARPGYLNLIPEATWWGEKRTDSLELFSGLHTHIVMHAHMRVYVHICTQINKCNLKKTIT